MGKLCFSVGEGGVCFCMNFRGRLWKGCATELMHDIPGQTTSKSISIQIRNIEHGHPSKPRVLFLWLWPYPKGRGQRIEGVEGDNSLNENCRSSPVPWPTGQANGAAMHKAGKWVLSNQTAWSTTRSHLAWTGNGSTRGYDPRLGDKVTAWRIIPASK